MADDFPRIERTRKLVADGSRYFGPYASASSVDEAMNLIRRLFPFRTCTIDIREGERALRRPCLLYHIKRCQGPCVEAVGRDAYRADIAQVELFLEGRQETVVRELRRAMAAASAGTEYERAAGLRDKIRAIERTMEDQKMAAFARTELDALGLARADAQAAVQVFAVRAGKLVGRDVYVLEVPAGAAGRRGARRVRPAVLQPVHPRAADGPGAVPPGRRPGPGGVPRRPAGPARPSRRPGSRREAAPRRPRGAERGRRARPRAGPLARRRGQDAGRARGARGRARAAGAADADRVLRHLDDPGPLHRGQHGRLRGGSAAERRLPAIPDPRRRRAGRRRQPRGDAPASPPPGSIGRGGECRGAPLGAARPRRRRRREGPAGRGRRRPRGARALGHPDRRAREGARGALPPGPAGPGRAPAVVGRRSTSSSGSATRPIASRSRTTASCAARRP